MTERERDLVALELGRMFLQYAKTINQEALAAGIRCGAEKCLLDISEILDREELSDFECVEEIVVRLEKAGLSTSRHDFG